MKTTTPSATKALSGQSVRTRPRWKHVDVQSTALGAVGNVSVELGQRAYRVVLNCANTTMKNSTQPLTVPAMEP
ncbi:MAG: hypothetical protein Kow0074_02650 [Candidatus Zixiibacteriota bacterium]